MRCVQLQLCLTWNLSKITSRTVMTCSRNHNMSYQHNVVNLLTFLLISVFADSIRYVYPPQCRPFTVIICRVLAFRWQVDYWPLIKYDYLGDVTSWKDSGLFMFQLYCSACILRMLSNFCWIDFLSQQISYAMFTAVDFSLIFLSFPP